MNNICAVRTFTNPTYLKPEFNLEKLPHEPLLATEEHQAAQSGLRLLLQMEKLIIVGAPLLSKGNPVCKHCGSLFYNPLEK